MTQSPYPGFCIKQILQGKVQASAGHGLANHLWRGPEQGDIEHCKGDATEKPESAIWLTFHSLTCKVKP